MIEVRSDPCPRICQGDIVKNVEHIEHVSEDNGVIEVSRIVYPLVIVLTQDCDLEQDFKFRWSQQKTSTHDKYLLSVLVAPLYNYDHVIAGGHLSELGYSMAPINGRRTQGTNLRNNETPRYHYLEFASTEPIANSVIDFKHYFSVNIEYLKGIKETHFVRRVADLFREDISLRFASFLSRIGLPESPRHTHTQAVFQSPAT